MVRGQHQRKEKDGEDINSIRERRQARGVRDNDNDFDATGATEGRYLLLRARRVRRLDLDVAPTDVRIGDCENVSKLLRMRRKSAFLQHVL